MAQYHSFLVRIWCSVDGEAEHLAGRLDHLQSGESKRFLDLDQLGTYLRELVGVSDLRVAAARTAEVACSKTVD
jgi:hypothetical protein